jgi:hypothetical protein
MGAVKMSSFPRFQALVFIGGILSCGSLVQCAAVGQSSQVLQEEPRALVAGHAYAVLTGPTNRRYEPRIRSIEIMHRETNERTRIEFGADSTLFVEALQAGDYELTRVQIAEGPFLAMADVNAAFTVHRDGVTYLGTWWFGVDSPRYGRMVVVTSVDDAENRTEAERNVRSRYPDQAGASFTMALLTPSSLQTRLYEVMPYPRIHRYFRRHWW